MLSKQISVGPNLSSLFENPPISIHALQTELPQSTSITYCCQVCQGKNQQSI